MVEKKPKTLYPVNVVIDTNIIFSGLLNSSGTISDLIFNSEDCFEYFSCAYMRIEIQKHWKKLLRISKLKEEELSEARFRLFSKIKFINESLIPKSTWEKAEQTCKDIDIDDTDFVAMTEHLKGHLWTGDKELYNGLMKKKYKNVVNTQDMLHIRKIRSSI